MKSRVRRGASRAKPGADGGRRWKAGFVGGMLQGRRKSDASALDAFGSYLGGSRGMLDGHYGGHINLVQKATFFSFAEAK